jgi:hypothetical protein
MLEPRHSETAGTASNLACGCGTATRSEDRERKQPAREPVPGRILVEQGRDLREAEDEDEVEEELERRDAVLGLGEGLAHAPIIHPATSDPKQKARKSGPCE